jgi:glucans biosynthesis protein C
MGIGMSGERGFARRHDLDFIRVVVFGLVIIYHTSLIFGTRHWLINSPSSSRIFDIVSLMSHPWRISILFLISGIASASLASRLPPDRIRAMRTRQLIPPLLFGAFVIVPPQMYVSVMDSSELRISYLDFWLTYVRFGTITNESGVRISLFTMQHLWFLAYLWLYITALMLILEFRKEGPALVRPYLRVIMRGRSLLGWPALFLAALRLAVYPIFGETLVVQTDWYDHIVYFSFFLFGFVIADDETFWAAVVERRYDAVILAGLSLLAIVSLFLLAPPESRGMVMVALHRVGRSIFQWSAIVSILGFCRVQIRRPNRVVTYLNKAVLTYYVLHQTVLLLIAFWLKESFGLNGWSFVVIVLASAACCGLLYEVQRRSWRMLSGPSST